MIIVYGMISKFEYLRSAAPLYLISLNRTLELYTSLVIICIRIASRQYATKNLLVKSKTKDHPVGRSFVSGRGTRALRFACELLVLRAAQLLGGAPQPLKAPHRGAFFTRLRVQLNNCKQKGHPPDGLFFWQGH
jgi:hypothetical protein